MSYFGNLFDAITARSAFIDPFRVLITAERKRITGATAGALTDTFMYTNTPTNGGTLTVTTGLAIFATNTTASGAIRLQSNQKARYMAGRSNILRMALGVGDTGVTGNVREWGIYIDASNQFNFRLSGSTFSVVIKKAGVETVVSSGSFNGASTTYVLDTSIRGFEIIYTTSAIYFVVDNVLIHKSSAITTSLISTVVGSPFISNTNTTIATNQIINVLTVSVSHIGSSTNNPNFYNINAVAETRTLKTGGGTLQSISVGRAATSGVLTIYDNTSGAGTIVAIFDIGSVSTIGTHVFGIEGVNFYNGLTYVTSGVMTNGSVTLFWE